MFFFTHHNIQKFGSFGKFGRKEHLMLTKAAFIW